MPKKKRKSNLLSMSNILHHLFDQGQSPLKDQFQRWKLWNSWAEVAGASIASYSDPVGYNRGVLIIWVKSSSHMQELTYILENLRDRINAFVGRNYVKSIRLTLDRKSVPTSEESGTDLREFLAKGAPSEGEEPPPDPSSR